jgi:hypothetical protein
VPTYMNFTRPRFELGTSWIKVPTVTASPNCSMLQQWRNVSGW